MHSTGSENERQGIFEKFSTEKINAFYYFKIDVSPDMKGNIDSCEVTRHKFDDDVTILSDVKSNDVISDVQVSPYRLRRRQMKKMRDDEIDTTLCESSNEESNNEEILSSEDEMYDVIADNWTYVRCGRRKPKISSDSKSKTSSSETEKSPKKARLKIKLKNEKLDKKRLKSIKKEETEIKKEVPEVPEPQIKVEKSQFSSIKSSCISTLISPTKKIFRRCGYNSTPAKVEEIPTLRIRRRFLKKTPKVKRSKKTISQEECQSVRLVPSNKIKIFKSVKVEIKKINEVISPTATSLVTKEDDEEIAEKKNTAKILNDDSSSSVTTSESLADDIAEALSDNGCSVADKEANENMPGGAGGKKKKKKRKKDRRQSNCLVDDQLDAEHTNARLAMELPRHNWLVNSLIKENKIKAEDENVMNSTNETENAQKNTKTIEGETKDQPEIQSEVVGQDTPVQNAPPGEIQQKSPESVEHKAKEEESKGEVVQSSEVNQEKEQGSQVNQDEKKRSEVDQEEGEKGKDIQEVENSSLNQEVQRSAVQTPIDSDSRFKSQSNIKGTHMVGIVKPFQHLTVHQPAMKSDMASDNGSQGDSCCTTVTPGNNEDESVISPPTLCIVDDDMDDSQQEERDPLMLDEDLVKDHPQQEETENLEDKDESDLKISNCFSLALDLSKKMEVKVEILPEIQDQPLDLSVGSKHKKTTTHILDLSVKTFVTPKSSPAHNSKTPGQSSTPTVQSSSENDDSDIIIIEDTDETEDTFNHMDKSHKKRRYDDTPESREHDQQSDSKLQRYFSAPESTALDRHQEKARNSSLDLPTVNSKIEEKILYNKMQKPAQRNPSLKRQSVNEMKISRGYLQGQPMYQTPKFPKLPDNLPPVPPSRKIIEDTAQLLGMYKQQSATRLGPSSPRLVSSYSTQSRTVPAAAVNQTNRPVYSMYKGGVPRLNSIPRVPALQRNQLDINNNNAISRAPLQPPQMYPTIIGGPRLTRPVRGQSLPRNTFPGGQTRSQWINKSYRQMIARERQRAPGENPSMYRMQQNMKMLPRQSPAATNPMATNQYQVMTQAPNPNPYGQPRYRNGGLSINRNGVESIMTRPHHMPSNLGILKEPIVIDDDPSPVVQSVNSMNTINRHSYSFHPPLSKNKGSPSNYVQSYRMQSPVQRSYQPRQQWRQFPSPNYQRFNKPETMPRPPKSETFEVCVVCRGKALFLCSGCKDSWYCSKDCQLKDWNSHSKKCG